MPNFTIRAHGLGKQYRLGRAEPYTTLRESLVRAAVGPARALGRLAGRVEPAEEAPLFWAIRDVSFEVKQGEVLGIVGRNGAGKSTLLKVLSRITEPTEGRAEVYGRVGSLLEVGTGFHPELSGRDNIYLNGSILGMDRPYIHSKLDEIVEFSGVERFIDTPVKRYSSGMYLRLAFAVAAHLEPEVLIVDEVLAVGDAEFQKKCLGKMDEVAQAGRTILFVSHNLAAVNRLCTRALLLQDGQVRMEGSAAEVTTQYMAGGEGGSDFSDARRLHRSTEAAITGAWLEREGAPTAIFRYGDPVSVFVRVQVSTAQRFSLEVVLRDQDHMPVVFFGSGIQHRLEFEAEPGEITLRMRIPHAPLAEGRFFLDLAVAETGRRYLDYLESALALDVELCDPEENGVRYYQAGKGSMYLPSEFEVAGGTAVAVRR
ncbi:MAG TPA: ABC transporter ATP-binding protein [Longimicrobium sp.]|jgi:lipopolysaccharide transport system ATP-binding protein|nr:ABC transporter ATP-binding protein [Longimicrobium sp.]